ncbi:hypothetical protein BHU72_04195 [Desulfuribacillus stibiiarsenatis]|uniref:peptide-methionine (S)-S-oxide reductase n=1 Tax=Desulfuribacillus stibiiarsenatis TaxID=1390249 RepID=A0A1E5L562_9FIRM|nr:hypothetical protein BHU72_04195 [Desulfuribacillus stibiiarsenatis]
MEGIVRTRVGYAGGTADNPTYHNLADHTECLQVEYDESMISYERILEWFWKLHNSTRRVWSRQYMPVLFYHDEQQKALAIASKELQQSLLGKVITPIEQYEKFFLAEFYHQKYYLQQVREVAQEIQKHEGTPQQFVDSTVAARLNGYIAGYGNLPQLLLELPDWKLSDAAKKLLIVRVSSYQS